VREIFSKLNPDALVVELPEDVRENVIRGIKRLPKISIVVFWDEILQSYLYTAIDPADSIIEGVRLALENNISCYFIDLNVKAYTPELKELPDDYIIKDLDLDIFYSQLVESNPSGFNLDKLTFEGFPSYFADFDIGIDNSSKNIKDKTISEKSQLRRVEKRRQKSFKHLNKQTKSLDQAREYYMACNLKQLMMEHKKVLLIVGLAHWERIKTFLMKESLNMDVLKYHPSVDSQLYNVEPKDIPLFLGEVPYFVYQWEKQWEKALFSAKRPNLPRFDKMEFIPVLFLKAIQEYAKRFNERITIQQSHQISQYLRNLVHYDKRVTPEIYHLVAASKNIVNDDFAWYIYKTAIYYPYAVKEDEDIQTIKIEGDQFQLGERRFKLRRRIPLSKKPRTLKIRQILDEKPGENWKEEWERDKHGICSWPEEDIILENKYNYVRRVGHNTLIEKLKKTHKFQGSFLDGIDIRETIRNFVNGKQIYVKETKNIKGSISTIVIIFEDERLTPFYQPNSLFWSEKYRHNISFYSEHEKESDLSFYSTEPGENIIGPGISIIKIGGLSSEYPPSSYNIGYWDCFNPSYNLLFKRCIWKSERLLLSSIFQSKGKYILYIAEKRPKKYFYERANLEKKKIIYLPISSFSSSTMNRLKYMHVLAGRFRRKFAGKYINLKKKFKF
jgi:hypothetical protein